MLTDGVTCQAASSQLWKYYCYCISSRGKKKALNICQVLQQKPTQSWSPRKTHVNAWAICNTQERLYLYDRCQALDRSDAKRTSRMTKMKFTSATVDIHRLF